MHWLGRLEVAGEVDLRLVIEESRGRNWVKEAGVFAEKWLVSIRIAFEVVAILRSKLVEPLHRLEIRHVSSLRYVSVLSFLR